MRELSIEPISENRRRFETDGLIISEPKTTMSALVLQDSSSASLVAAASHALVAAVI